MPSVAQLAISAVMPAQIEDSAKGASFVLNGAEQEVPIGIVFLAWFFNVLLILLIRGFSILLLLFTIGGFLFLLLRPGGQNRDRDLP